MFESKMLENISGYQEVKLPDVRKFLHTEEFPELCSDLGFYCRIMKFLRLENDLDGDGG